MLKAGIAGCGAVANLAHAPGYKAARGVETVACYDKEGARARAFAETWGIPRAYTNFQEMLGRESLDAISICTPNYTHKELTVTALEAGVNVICEKPMAMNASEALEMLEASTRTKKVLTIAHQHRFTREAQSLKRFIEDGKLGEIYFARSQALIRTGIPWWGEFHKKAKSGGGVLIDNGVHIIDLCLWLMGNPKPVTVSGAVCTKFGNRSDIEILCDGNYDRNEFDVEDFAYGCVRFANGAVMSIETAWAAHIEEDVRLTQQFLGDKGGATLYPFRVFGQGYGVLLDVTPKVRGENNGYLAEIERFLAAVRGEKDVLVKPDESCVVMQIIDAIYQSSREAKEIVLAQS
jgi:predicted dehydrogenase